MHIAHSILNFSSAGGIGVYLRRLIAAQLVAGHQVSVFERGGDPQNNLPAGAELVVVGDDDQLLSEAQRRGVSIIHAHDCLEPERGFGSVPIFRQMHGHWPYCPSGSRFLGRWGRACDRAYSPLGCAWGHMIDHCGSVRPARFIEDFNNRGAEQRMFQHTRTATVSDFVRQQMIRSGYDAARIDTLLLPAPQHDEAPTKLPPQPRFVFLGRLVPQKGCDWLIKSLAATEARIELDIAGDGPMRQELQSLALRLGVHDRVRFLGWLNESAAKSLIDEARALVFPSLWPEPAGLVTLESAAAGRAAIVSNIGGIPEYAHATGHALLVEPGSVAALAGALTKLGRDPELAEQLGGTGRQQVVTRFSMSDHLQAMQNLYHRAIESFAHAT